MSVPVLAFTRRPDDPLTPRAQANRYMQRLRASSRAAAERLAERLGVEALFQDEDAGAVLDVEWKIENYWQTRAEKAEKALRRVLALDLTEEQRALADKVLKGATRAQLPSQATWLPAEVQMVLNYRTLDDATRAAFRTMIDRLSTQHVRKVHDEPVQSSAQSP
jgi:hypothetical protein